MTETRVQYGLTSYPRQWTDRIGASNPLEVVCIQVQKGDLGPAEAARRIRTLSELERTVVDAAREWCQAAHIGCVALLDAEERLEEAVNRLEGSLLGNEPYS